ncbi:MAG TPA: lysophospholipid acyltransferase family protein [Gemmatimonadaceae bacterium]|jgi:1-acyl-sn-glycerol-3-phosphate acyltransferase
MQIEIGTSVPRRGGRISGWLGWRGLGLMGWRIVGAIPDQPKLVAIVAPHSSNWDFVVGLLARYALRLDASWLGKHTLFHPPFGWIMRRWGGIAVDRTASHDVVSSTVAAFSSRPRVFLVIAPEGTRKQVSRWKTGFWHIARGAGVPILPIVFDWRDRAIRLLPPYITGPDLERDLAELRALFPTAAGKNRS